MCIRDRQQTVLQKYAKNIPKFIKRVKKSPLPIQDKGNSKLNSTFIAKDKKPLTPRWSKEAPELAKGSSRLGKAPSSKPPTPLLSMLKRRLALKQIKERISKIILPLKQEVRAINTSIKPILILPEVNTESSEFSRDSPKNTFPVSNPSLLLPPQIMPLEEQQWHSTGQKLMLSLPGDFSSSTEPATGPGTTLLPQGKQFSEFISKLHDPIVALYDRLGDEAGDCNLCHAANHVAQSLRHCLLPRKEL
eukprot:TRINITY_DN19369_c0_g1_i1.p2 TRINITY_DN19369_c0_g1~~TRINITY_DN19369_c0_g1_i1.p2  ORF type:complete len:248 (-),score=15.30 TRINITY_DN19369_c0_g1_i1:16-759(-)